MYNTFELEEDDFQSNSSFLKTHSSLNGRAEGKFMSGTITQNFFKPPPEDEDDYLPHHIPSQQGEPARKREEESVKQRRSKRQVVRYLLRELGWPPFSRPTKWRSSKTSRTPPTSRKSRSSPSRSRWSPRSPRRARRRRGEGAAKGRGRVPQPRKWRRSQRSQ